MKSAGTQSISMALRSIVVATFGLIFMFITSPQLAALTLAVLPITLIAFRTCACCTSHSWSLIIIISLNCCMKPDGNFWI